MDLERFTQIIGAYGGNPARWPLTERQAALMLLKTSMTAHQLQQEAFALDTVLDTASVSLPTPLLTARILAKIQSRQADSWQWLIKWLWGTTITQHLWRPTLAVGLPLIFGLGFSLFVIQQQEQLIQYITVSEATQDEFSELLDTQQQTLSEWSQWL